MKPEHEALCRRLEQHALPDPHDEREVMHAPLLREAALAIRQLSEAPDAKDGEKVVASIVADLRDRKGLGDEWDNIDADIQAEIIETWEGLVNASGKESRDG